MAARLVLAGTLLLAACGGGGGDDSEQPDAAPATTDIGGWYEVTAHREGECGMTQDVTFMPVPYLWVEPFSGIFYVRYCSGTAEADCYATPFYDFTRPIEGGWAAAGGSAFFSAGCTLSWERDEAILSGDQLRVRSLRYTVTEEIPESECTLEAAEALTEPCTYEVGLEAARM